MTTPFLVKYDTMEQIKKYAVVEFVNDESVETIPTCWLTNDNSAAYWPPCKTVQRFKKFVTERTTPDKTSWELCSVRVMKLAGNYAFMIV